jgi:tRNA pseudouridine55 synthase
MDGILNIHKPLDMTSFAVVSAVKKISGEKHIGHAGTLDPQATGVLPICLGQATRVIEFLFDETKTYRAEVELGRTTDTYDSSGKVIKTGDISEINRELIEQALPRFRGSINQMPPMYSALKHKGKPLYKFARAGIEIERKCRAVRVERLDIVDLQPPLVTLEIVCGKGTYIRCIAHDLGEVLGCGGNMKSLVRLRVGPFGLEEALTLPQLEEVFRRGKSYQYLYPVDHVLMNFKAMVVNSAQQCSLIHGAAIKAEMVPEIENSIIHNSLSRVYTEQGFFLGMVRYDLESISWKPEKIFFRGCCKSIEANPCE